MIHQKVMLSVVVIAFTVFSQQINISGKVTDRSGVTPISGVAVKLEKYGLADTTTADGSFTLTGAVSIGRRVHQVRPNALSANMHNGRFSLYVPDRCAITITTYTIQGKAVSKIRKVLDRGPHSIAQPGLGDGVYVYKIQAGSRELVLKSSSVGRAGGASTLRSPATVITAASSSARRYAPIDDVVFASKEGLLHYRGMATNSDTSGIVIKMIPNAGNVTDEDENVYQSVGIGNQVWMAENWRSTKYNDGTAIPQVTDDVAWGALTTPAYCIYNNETNADTIKKWGVLYNWYVVNPSNAKKIAPAGWHVPTAAEWDTLQTYLVANGFNWDGSTSGNKIAKALAAKTDWESDTVAGTIGTGLSKNNATGFSALPGGYRNFDGAFCDQSNANGWWSVTEFNASIASYSYLFYNYKELYLSRYSKYTGFSVRLLRD